MRRIKVDASLLLQSEVIFFSFFCAGSLCFHIKKSVYTVRVCLGTIDKDIDFIAFECALNRMILMKFILQILI